MKDTLVLRALIQNQNQNRREVANPLTNELASVMRHRFGLSPFRTTNPAPHALWRKTLTTNGYRSLFFSWHFPRYCFWLCNQAPPFSSAERRKRHRDGHRQTFWVSASFGRHRGV